MCGVCVGGGAFAPLVSFEKSMASKERAKDKTKKEI